MELSQVTFAGPPIGDGYSVPHGVPPNLVALLRQINGFVQFRGGLHLRGLCSEPNWHSLEAVMDGELALYRGYRAIKETDVPFAQDCVADQFILRDGIVHKLYSETGDLQSLDLKLPGFFAAIDADPVAFLEMHPLLQFEREGGSLKPGEVIHVYPPFCTKESGNGVSLRAMPVEEALVYLPAFARQISALRDGEEFQIKVGP